MQPILVTGGAGFIGGEFVRQWIAEESSPVINLDKLTYAGNLESLASVADDPRHIFVQGDIGDTDCIRGLLQNHRPRAIVNFAAESHVDRSIDGPAAFVETNVLGTFRLLEETRAAARPRSAGTASSGGRGGIGSASGQASWRGRGEIIQIA